MIGTFSLFIYIPFHNIFGRLMTNRPDIIPVTPKFSTPQLLSNFWKSMKNFLSRNTLHNFCYPGRRISGKRTQENMNVIPICSNTLQNKFISLTDALEQLFHGLGQLWSKKQILPIFHNPNVMISNIKPSMGSRFCLSHTPQNISYLAWAHWLRGMPFPAPLNYPPNKVTPPQVTGFMD
jgi:hypothetical protein